MDENQVIGGVKQATGRIYDAVGALTGDAQTQLDGKARQVAGKAQSAYGDIIDTLENALTEQPLAVIAVAAGLGFLTGTLLARR